MTTASPLRHSFSFPELLLLALLPFAPAMAGDLNPPGPPGSEAADMRTLNEIEPRTVITTLPYSITNGGVYYLTRNLTATGGTYGIIVNANDVIIDLNGYTLSGIQGTTDGIYINGTRERIRVRGGGIRNWGESAVDGNTANNCRYEDLLIWSNGTASANGFMAGPNSSLERCIFLGNQLTGLYVADGCKVENCIFRSNGGFGVFAGKNVLLRGCTATDNTYAGFRTTDNSVVTECNAIHNGADGFYTLANTTLSRCSSATNTGDGFNISHGCVISDSVAMGNSNGFKVYRGALVRGCVSYDNTQDGFNSFYAAKIESCSATQNDGDGIDVATGSSVTDCMTRDNGSAGIRAATDCRIVNNSSDDNYYGIYLAGRALASQNLVSGNTNGLYVTSSNSVVIQNVAIGNNLNYSYGAGNAYGASSTNSGAITNLNPWLNFSF